MFLEIFWQEKLKNNIFGLGSKRIIFFKERITFPFLFQQVVLND